MTVEKCDVCKKTIPDRQSGVGVRVGYKHFGLCKTCAVPILTVIKKYKLNLAV